MTQMRRLLSDHHFFRKVSIEDYVHAASSFIEDMNYSNAAIYDSSRTRGAFLEETTRVMEHLFPFSENQQNVTGTTKDRQQDFTSKEKTLTLTTTFSQSQQVSLWGNSTVLPNWMKEYLNWHQEQRQHYLNESTWRKYRYLVMVAPSGRVAGGITDRLRPLSFMIRIASINKRILLIHWERPAALEEFLLPPIGGLDWRTPDYLIPHIRNVQPNGNQKQIVKFAKRKRIPIQTTFYQSWNYGELYYDENLEPGEPDAKTVLRELWHIAFTPSPPVAVTIEDELQQMGIVPGEYVTAHIRALYAINKRDIKETKELTINAMNCASELRPGGPFLVASDSPEATQTALEYGKEKNVAVVSRSQAHHREPLHIGYYEVNATMGIEAADFYDTFVDIYLISMTRCVAFGKGGYGRWGLLMGYNQTCHHAHHGSKWAQQCTWTEPSTYEQTEWSEHRPKLELPLFRAPMPDNRHMSGTKTNT